MSRSPMRVLLACVLLAAGGAAADIAAAPAAAATAAAATAGATTAAAPDPASDPIPVKVMVVNTFSLEAQPWLAALAPRRRVRVPGLSADYPDVACTDDGICQVTTGMGHANAAASMMALLLSGRFDLRRTYFLIAGIAGINPAYGTMGSVTWARYAVDVGLTHEIDARERPPSWPDGFFGIGTDGPGEKPKFEYRTEMFHLDDGLESRAFTLSRSAQLEDAADAAAYRRHYPFAPANLPPAVTECDTAAGDTFWSGARLGEYAARWTRLLTDGKGRYCTTEEEDTALMNALTRGAGEGRIDLRRVMILRSGSDFDRPYPGQSAYDCLIAQRAVDGAVHIAAVNLVHAGLPVVRAIAGNWARWADGVPPAP
ncbi:MAG TPA: purine nucleoside permease [Steroidobacteraceae bacterium]|nr:purine nucleoside permease [Steroidobacteraceae bacterium]